MLWPWPLTRWPWKFVVDLVSRGHHLCKFDRKIEQSPAELFTIWHFFARVTSRCDLDLWPLDLELLWYFRSRVSKPCVKFERNRAMRGRVIHDLAHFRRQIFDRGPNPRVDLRVHGPNCTKLAEDKEGLCPSLQFVSDFRYHAAFSNAGRSKSSYVSNDVKFRTFWPPPL